MEHVCHKSQDGWGMDDYYALWRYLNRMFLKKETTLNEIKEIDLAQCTDETKALILCTILQQKNDELLQLENLRDLEFVTPLAEPLYLVAEPIKSYKVFEDYNIKL